MKTIGTTLAAAGAALALAAPAGAQEGVVVADHLNNPRQLEVQPSGAVYVAEAGRGGNRCVQLDPEFTACYGYTSGVTRVAPGRQSRVVSGLLSVAGPDGTFAGGVSAIAASAFGGFVGIQNGQFGGLPNFSAAATLQDGALMSFSPFNRGGSPRVVAQVDDHELSENPAGDQIDPNPYGVEATADGYYVTDAGGNSLLHVTRRGEIHTVATFEDIDGRDAVPTSVRQGPDGALYVGTLVGEQGEEPGEGEQGAAGLAKVYRVVPGEEPAVHADGLTSVVGLDFDDEGNLYVAEFTDDPEQFSPFGSVVRITPEGDRTRIGQGELFFPGGVAVGDDGAVYVSNWSVMPAHGEAFGPGSRGQVVRFDQPE